MANLREALSDIRSIRALMARCIEFRGYGPTTLAITGVLAIAVASIEEWDLFGSARDPWQYLWVWIGTAAVSLILIGIETVARARRIHSGLAMQMVHSAFEQFLPAIVAGILITVVMARFSPQNLWMLPGLWQVLFSLGVFASCRFLPRATFWVGVWYLAAGLTCLALGHGDSAFSPWEMGVPFGLGQLMVAGVLQFGYRDHDEAY